MSISLHSCKVPGQRADGDAEYLSDSLAVSKHRMASYDAFLNIIELDRMIVINRIKAFTETL